MSELWRLGAAELTQGYARGEFTPGEALESCLARVAEMNPALNAMVQVDRTTAKLAASASRMRWARHKPFGPLDGVPITLKDSFHAAGLPTSWGSKLLHGFVARTDEAVVARLRAAGAIIFGKTNLPEFALQGYTANDVTGVTRNPWNTALTPGGSSGGAAAAIAAGFGPLALATDGGGSTRRPASHCGVIGFKPSAGRVPREGGLPQIFLDFETAGAIGRTVADVHMMMQVAAGEPAAALPAARPSRILYVPRFADHVVHSGIAASVAQAAQRLRALGHEVEEAGRFDLAEPVNAVWPLLASTGLAAMLGDADRLPEFGLQAGETANVEACTRPIQDGLRDALQGDGIAVFEAFTAVHNLKRELGKLFARHDFILTPATAALPWPADQPYPPLIDGHPVGPRGHAVFTAFANAAGLPGIAMPSGQVDSLPTGFQLVAPQGHDEALLALAAQYEAAHPWAAWPPLAAGA